MTKETLERAHILTLRIDAIEITIENIERDKQVYFKSHGTVIPSNLLSDIGVKALTELTLTFLNSQLLKYQNEFNSL